jgi:hypothetical protein
MGELYILSLPISLDEMDNYFNVYFSEQVDNKYPLLNTVDNKHDCINNNFKIIETIQHQVETNEYIDRSPLCMKNTLVKIDEINRIPQSKEYTKDNLLSPSKTNVYCWWCCHPFDDPVIYCPVSYQHKRETFKVKGVFCSYNCSYAHSMKDPSVKDKSLIKFMYKVITGSNFQNINPSPPKEILKIFGGSKTIEEFRELSKNNSMSVNINSYPLVYVSQQIETREIISLVNESMKNVNKVKNAKINIKREVLKSIKKKDKQSVSNDTSLEALMGIIIK